MAINLKILDMKTIFNCIGKHLILLFTAALLVTACKKTKETALDPPRLFKASDISVVAGETSAKIKWGVPLFSSGKPLTYTVDFSLDPSFTTVAYSKIVDTAGITVTQDDLKVRTPYYARIKANAFEDQPESKPIISSPFQITGVQYFKVLKEVEVFETRVTLHFIPTVGISSIVLKPSTGAAITVPLSVADAASGDKVISGLSPGVAYAADLFMGTRNVGYLNFTTLPQISYTTTVPAGGDLSSVITAAADGAIIGLADGTYNIPTTISIVGKTITLKSISSDPKAVKVNFKGFTLVGTGAGIKVNGIDFDGLTYNATYFADLTSASGNSVPATFTTIVAENSFIHNIGTSIIRGDRLAGYVIGDINFKNSMIYDITGSSSYYVFHLDKMIFKSLTINQCTFYNFPLGLVNCKTTVAMTIPTINISSSTFNNFGTASSYVFLNASANPVVFNIANSILANAPRAGATVLGTILSTGTGSSSTFSFNNYFNLLTTSGGTALTIPATTTSNNQTINLGWTTTPNFTLPSDSPLQKSGSTGGVVGDPRWAY
jgi:hypothetical protein